jgi:hypothetical protein
MFLEINAAISAVISGGIDHVVDLSVVDLSIADPSVVDLSVADRFVLDLVIISSQM